MSSRTVNTASTGLQEAPPEADTDNMRVVLQDIGQMIVERNDFVSDAASNSLQIDNRGAAPSAIVVMVDYQPSSTIGAFEEVVTHDTRPTRPRRNAQANRSVEEVIIVPDATQQSPVTPRAVRKRKRYTLTSLLLC